MAKTIFKKHDKATLNDFFQRPYWEWMFTGSMEPETSNDQASRMFAKWRTHIARTTGIQIASVGVFSKQNGKHLHALLVGRNRRGRTLSDISEASIEDFEKLWRKIAHRPAMVTIAKDDKLPCYLTENILYNSSGEIDYIHNINLLKRLNREAA